jgi:hypothetical protein
MTGMQPKQNLDGMWTYPNSKEKLKAVGLGMIDHYIGFRRETIARFIVDWPLFALCQVGERMRGSMRCTFWWEQLLSLDVTESLPGSKRMTGIMTFHWDKSVLVGYLYG